MWADQEKRWTAACLGVLYVVWGSTYLAQRIVVATFPPLSMAGVRFVASGALLYGLVRARGAAPPSRREWRAAAASALPMLVLGMGSVAVAMQRVPSGLAALVFGSVPLWASLLDTLWGGRLSRAELAGLGVGLSGVTLVTVRGGLDADPGGAALLVFAAMAYALGCVLTRRLRLARGALGTASQMLAGGAMLLACAAFSGERPAWPTASALSALVYLVVFGSMLGYAALGWLLRRARPALATSYAYVNPIVALGLGSALGGERFGAADVAGLALVLIAVALVAVGGARARAAGPPPRGSTVAGASSLEESASPAS